MRLALTSIAAVSFALAAPAAPALAQAAGTQVVDTSGGAVGTVVRDDGSNVIIKTDKHEVALPKTSFTPDKGKLLFGMTQAQLNAATEKSLAEAAAAIAPGATVKGSGGAVLGTIDAVDSEFVTIKLQSGSMVRIPRSGVAAGNGEVVIGLTAQELEAQSSPSGSTASSQ
jgi:preprotein translocase subunit YajC